MLFPGRDVNAAPRWLAIAAIAVILIVSMALGYGLVPVLAARGHTAAGTAMPTVVATHAAATSSPQYDWASEMDLQIHEQDYCQCRR